MSKIKLFICPDIECPKHMVVTGASNCYHGSPHGHVSDCSNDTEQNIKCPACVDYKKWKKQLKKRSE